MYAYFDDTKRFWYYILMVYGSCIPLYALLRSLHISILVTCISIILIELLCYVGIVNYFVNKANRYMHKIEDILYQDCDVQRFQIEISKLLERPVKNQTQRCRLLYLMAISKSLQVKTDEVTDLFEDMSSDVSRLGNEQKWPIYVAMAQNYMDAQKFEQANVYVQRAKECKNIAKLHSVFDDSVLEEAIHRYQYMIGEESTHAYIAFLKMTCKEKADTPFHKLIIYTQLMEMSRRTKNANDSTMCAYYIVKHAKDIPCVEAANKLLDGEYE